MGHLRWAGKSIHRSGKGPATNVIHGIIWYQGEWDARGGGAENYYLQLECLIEEWRTDWRLTEVKFYIVQMPKMGIGKIHIVRDAELHNYFLDDTVEMIVSIDFEDGGDAVHPPKEQFGKRLSNLALMKEYGQPIEASSPVHNENLSYADGQDITVVFNHTYGGLSVQTQTPEAEWEVSNGGNSWYPVTTLSIVDGRNYSGESMWGGDSEYFHHDHNCCHRFRELYYHLLCGNWRRSWIVSQQWRLLLE